MPVRRNPDKTREDLLLAGFNEIHKNGFRAADVNVILAEAGVTKGALYHHFESKRGLGLAVLDEVVREMVLETWVRPLRESDNPVDAMIGALENGCANAEDHVKHGCPLNNLAQEMAPVDEEFRQRIERLYDLWRRGLAEGLARGQANDTVRRDVEAESTAAFFVAACEGTMGLAKSAQSAALLEVGAKGLLQYLDSLRASGSTVAASSSDSSAEAPAAA